jgi:hypothetical protein
VSVPKQAAAALVAAVAALSLSGCGISNPGVASEVGDQTVSTSDVNRLTTGYCDALRPQLESGGQIYPIRYLRGYVVGNLTVKAAAEQLADNYGVTLGADYQETLKDLETQYAALPADSRDEVIEVETAGAYITAVEHAVGSAILEGEGDTGADDDARVSRGRDELQLWLADHPADVNPRYGIQITNADFTFADTSTSYPLTPNAVAADKAQPDQTYAATLPSSQRCG